MKTDTTSFISNEYRPSGIILQDPRNMHLDDIRKVLQHCYRLQVKSGPESAFRFAVFVGPKRKRIIANYPEAFNPQSKESEPNHRKKKNKGKQREDPLEGLLRIDESVEPRAAEDIANPRVAGASRNRSQNIPEPGPSSHQDGVVRINMGQMLQLQDMGYEVLGPVNGPNEGYPEYEIPKTMFEALIAHTRLQNALKLNEPQLDVGPEMPDLALIPIDPILLTTVVPDGVHMPPEGNIDIGQHLPPAHGIVGPSLSSHLSATNVPTTHLNDNVCLTTPPNNTVWPTTPLNDNASPAGDGQEIQNKTPKKRLGKRIQNLSPQTTHQTQTQSKKKKVTDDDLAALEAQNMMQSGSRRRSKPTQRK